MLVATIQIQGTSCLSAIHCAAPITAPAIKAPANRSANGADGQVRGVAADRKAEDGASGHAQTGGRVTATDSAAGVVVLDREEDIGLALRSLGCCLGGIERLQR